MTTYNLLFTGTGPLAIIEGCKQAENGQRVLFVDDKNQVGGAWVAIPVGTYGELEIGCHIWSYNKAAYAFVQKTLNLGLIDLNPQPYFLKGDVKIGYDRKHFLSTFQRSMKYISRLKLKGALNYLKENPAARMPIFSKTYKYPKGGARDIQQALSIKINTSSAEKMLNERIERLEKKGDNWEAITASGKTILSESVVLTSTSSIKTIKKGNREIQLNHRVLNYVHFHMVFDKMPIKPFSYIRVLSHHVIHRISDITYQLTENQAGRCVILVGVFDEKMKNYKSDDEVIAVIVDYLKNKAFIAKDTELLYAQKNTFKTMYLSGDQINEIKALDTQLNCLHSTDFMYGIHYRLKEWEKLKA